nr:hypothetical protein [uncultured Methanolobus sp.]
MSNGLFTMDDVNDAHASSVKRRIVINSMQFHNFIKNIPVIKPVV